MSGRAYTVDAHSMNAAARAVKTLGGLLSQISHEVGGIQVPPGVEGAPQAKLGVVSRRLAQAGRAVASEGPLLSNAARWAALFEAPGGAVSPLSFSGFPGADPALVSPFANTDATNHRGNDWFAGVVSPIGDIAKSLPGAALLLACPPAWVIKNQESIRWGVANTGKLGREAWRDAYASDAADAGDRDYAWGQRTTTLLTLPFFYARAAKSGAAAIKAGENVSLARGAEAARRGALDDVKRTRPGARWRIGTGPDGKIVVTDLTKQHGEALKAAEDALAAASRARLKSEAKLGFHTVQTIRKTAGAAHHTGAAVVAPVSADNVENARDREQHGR